MTGTPITGMQELCSIATMTQPAPESGAGIDTARTMSALLVDMNHDIRTAMSGLAGMLDLLGEAGLTDTQLRHLRKAQSSTHALMTLIDRITDLSLIESGRFRLASGRFDLQREAEAAFAGKSEDALAKGLVFSANLPAQFPTLDGDAARVQTLLSCLLDTMIRLVPQGEVSAALSTASEQADQCRIELKIKAGPLPEEGRQLIAMMAQEKTLDTILLCIQGKKVPEAILAAQLSGFLGARIDAATDQANISTLQCSFVLPNAAHPHSRLRALLIAERAAEWRTLLAPFTGPGIHIESVESAMDGLIALKRSANEGTPYRIVMLGERVQGMDATILSTAIKGDNGSRDAMLVMLNEREAGDNEGEAAFAQAGFSFVIGKSASPDAIRRVLEQLRNNVTTNACDSFVSTGGTEDTIAPASSRSNAARPSAGRRVLIADDNPVNREIAARMLEKMGYECALAADGRAAIDMHRSQPFDMILMDCDMPHVDGFQATAIIRSAEDISGRTPVIALTASTSQGEREKCLASGMDDYLSKPIRPQLLSEILARWLPAELASSEQPDTSADAALGDEIDAVRVMFGKDFPELAHLYQRDTPPRIASLHRAYADGDCHQVAKVAHALGGSSASIGATGLSGLCRTIETQARSGTLDGFEQAMDRIENEYGRISSKLQALID